MDDGGLGQTTARHRVGIFLLDHYTVFDEFGKGGWDLAPYWSWSRRNRLLLRRATGQKQAKHQPSFPHALCFPPLVSACRWQSWLHAPTRTHCEGGRLANGWRTEWVGLDPHRHRSQKVSWAVSGRAKDSRRPLRLAELLPA